MAEGEGEIPGGKEKKRTERTKKKRLLAQGEKNRLFPLPAGSFPSERSQDPETAAAEGTARPRLSAARPGPTAALGASRRGQELPPPTLPGKLAPTGLPDGRERKQLPILAFLY